MWIAIGERVDGSMSGFSKYWTLRLYTQQRSILQALSIEVDCRSPTARRPPSESDLSSSDDLYQCHCVQNLCDYMLHHHSFRFVGASSSNHIQPSPQCLNPDNGTFIHTSLLLRLYQLTQYYWSRQRSGFRDDRRCRSTSRYEISQAR